MLTGIVFATGRTTPEANSPSRSYFRRIIFHRRCEGMHQGSNRRRGSRSFGWTRKGRRGCGMYYWPPRSQQGRCRKGLRAITEPTVKRRRQTLRIKPNMPRLFRAQRRRRFTVLASARRRIQKLGPCPSMVLMVVPLILVEPLKLAALFLAGNGHWLTGTWMIVAAYAGSLLIVERLFRTVKPKLMTIGWFARVWTWFVGLRDKVISWGSRRSVAIDRVN